MSVCSVAGGGHVIVRTELQAQQDIGLGKSHSVLNTVQKQKALGKLLTYSDAFFTVTRRSKLKPRAGVGSQYFKQSSKTNCIFHFPKHIVNKEEV